MRGKLSLVHGRQIHDHLCGLAEITRSFGVFSDHGRNMRRIPQDRYPLPRLCLIRTDPLPPLDREQDMNYVHSMFSMVRPVMIRSVFEEAVALASLSLFLATVAVWAQLLGVL
jgi:hypothetical protein